MLVSAVADVVSLGAVLPFLSILVAPNSSFNHRIVAVIGQFWPGASVGQLAWPLTVLFVLAALISAAMRMLFLWVGTRLAFASGAEISIELYRRALYQPYKVHVARNSSVVISGIINNVAYVVHVLSLSTSLVSSVVLLTAIMLTLIAIEPVVAVVTAASFGGAYGLVVWVTRRRLDINSQRIAYEQTQVVKALQEGLGGIRDVLLDGSQAVYSDIYHRADYALRRALAVNSFIGASPRFAMEALAMALIAFLAYWLTTQPEGIGRAVPVLGALALGAQRLIPALQQIFAAWAGIAGSRAALTETIDLLDQPLPMEALHPVPPLTFCEDIRFDRVSFCYANNGPFVVQDVSLVISRGARIGFVGSTGSGKSTLLDLLMGLLEPSEGAILVDGKPIGGNQLRAWQQTIAHVPQNIFLADITLCENIAFGIPPDRIELKRVREAASQAQIADFIEGLPDRYDAYVGERGIRLSGGQRQRIGIARALYKQAAVLVFDEATSALDSVTEQSVMDAIDGLNRDLTILLATHRISTVRHCDVIVELEHGRVAAQGTYEQLLESSPSFRSLAGLAKSGDNAQYAPG